MTVIVRLLAIKGIEMDPDCECTLWDANSSKQASISEENSVFMISQFEPLITNIELSKAQKYQPSALSLIPQEETFNPVPVFKAQCLVVSSS